jgi:hypothetical protein
MSKMPSSLVHQTATTTGTGNFTLVAVNGKRSFNTAFGNGATTNVFDYFISHRAAAEWEIGTGHMSDATTLVRDTVVTSSNANALVNFAAGTKDVTNDIPANENIFFADATGIYSTETSNPALALFASVASAVCWLTVTNAVTAGSVIIGSDSSDVSSPNLDFIPEGEGRCRFYRNAVSGADWNSSAFFRVPSGVPGDVGLGGRTIIQLDNSANDLIDAGWFGARWVTATAAAEVGEFAIGVTALTEDDSTIVIAARAVATATNWITFTNAATGGMPSIAPTGDLAGLTFGASFLSLTEMSAPAAGAANTARLFVRDNGSAKSQLCAIFASGAVQVIVTEP